MEKHYYAHSPSPAHPNGQLLSEHLKNAAVLARRAASVFGAEAVGVLPVYSGGIYLHEKGGRYGQEKKSTKTFSIPEKLFEGLVDLAVALLSAYLINKLM